MRLKQNPISAHSSCRLAVASLVSTAALCCLLLSSSTLAKTKRPSDKEIEAALGTLVQLALSEDAASPARKMIGVSIFTLTALLAGVDIANGPGQTLENEKLAVTSARLKKKGIDVGVAIEPMLQEMKKFQCRAMQSAAKIGLQSLMVSEESYRAEFDTYDKNLKKIGFVVRDDTYRFTVMEASATAYRARATGTKGPVKGDIWEIDQDNRTTHVKSTCGK